MIEIPLSQYRSDGSAKASLPGGGKLAFLLGILVLAIVFPGRHSRALERGDGTIQGVVRDGESLVPGAIVRIQATEFSTVTDTDGLFELAVPETCTAPVKLTAWAKGYYIAGPVEASPGRKDITILLHRHGSMDNPEYSWQTSALTAGSGENQGCAECHSRGTDASGPVLPVDEWLKDAHSRSGVNPRFLTMYSGTDLSGRQSPPTRYMHIRDYGTFPLAPDPGKQYYGPGYKLDYPDQAGNCAACHLPAAAVNAPYDTDPVQVRGVGREGVNCDFCHKVWDVLLDPVTGLPFPNRPGVLSFEFRRPEENHQFFAGPLDDIAPGEDTYSELQKRSQFCAPCHFGMFWDTVVYDSFGEWLRSPYSRTDTGKTCQECHMPNSGPEYFALPAKGGLKRNPQTIVGHEMPGARDPDLLRNAVSMKLAAERSPNGIRVRTEIINDRTGHHVPTDSPLRHLILLVRAYGEDGTQLALKTGPVLPELCGLGDPTAGCYAGLPGKVYAKLLEEMWTGISPAASYWNPTRVVMDTRLGAFESDSGEFLFAVPEYGTVQVQATLLYRRAYKDLMIRKGWEEPDIVMESARVSISQNSGSRIER
jgi:mono/diheme cytochrome c family protein